MSKHTKAIARGIAYLLTVNLDALCVIDQALVVRAIGSVPGLDAVRQQLIAKLQTSATDAWIASASLADVFTVINALHYHDARLVQGDRLALLVRRLLQAEHAPGGPYSDTTKLDPYTNAVINQFASWAAEPLPNVTAYLQSADIDTRTEHHTAIYDTERPTTAQIKRYLANQQADGSWHHDAVCTARAIQKIVAANYQLEERQRTDIQQNSGIFSRARKESMALSPNMQAQMQKMLKKIERANKRHEISLLARYVQDLLPKQTSAHIVEQLGLANIYGWLAYTIYDGMLDHEADTSKLSLANIAARQSYTYYYQSATPAQWQLVIQAFQRVDEANDWELSLTRAAIKDGQITIAAVPDYADGKKLAERSYIHILGPLLLAQRSGLSAHHMQTLRTGLEQYLIARQLNDDIHDWKEDLHAGQITYVLAQLFRLHGIKPGTYNLATLTKSLQQQFREEYVGKLC